MLGVLLAAGVVLIHVPAMLWAGNTAEFTFAFTPFLALGLAALTVALLATLMALRLLPPAARRVVACLLGALGLAAWAYGTVLVGPMRVLNGVDAPMDFDTALGSWELPLVGAAVLVVAGALSARPVLSKRLLLVLNGILGLATAATVASAQPTLLTTDTATVLRFSPVRNVLVVLLDGLQAGVADRVLRKDPALAARFDGFVFFKDTLGVAPTTFLSLPAIHSGEVYHGQGSLAAYFAASIGRRSFMTRFAGAGYETTLVNPVENICPVQMTSCMRTADLRPPRVRLRTEALHLLDLSLFRVAPIWIKRRIYRDGQWLFAGQFDRPNEVEKVMEDNRFLERLSRDLVVAGDRPTIKFLHMLSTHTPYVLEGDCRTVGESTLDHLDPQSHCALTAVATLFGRLKEAGVYDQTVILVLGDHGVNPGVFPDPGQDEYARWVHRAGAANPVFLLKRLESRGALAEAPAAVSLADVGATLCAASSACGAPLGFAAGTAPSMRPRRFNDYRWRHEFWTRRSIPEITPYEVDGPLWEQKSWRRIP